MKLILLFMLLFGLNSNAQLGYFVEHNVSLSTNFSDITDGGLVIDNNISIGVKKNKMLFSAGVGREDWNFGYFSDNPNPSYTAYCNTYKTSALLERQFFIPKTKLSIRLGVGAKLYFLNQMKDSLSNFNERNILNTLKPSVLLTAKETWQQPFKDVGLVNFYYITSIPYAFTANLAFQYNFKKFGLKLYFEPYFMKIKYRNVVIESLTGSLYAFYYNIGLGVHYPLNFKKKDKKATGIE